MALWGKTDAQISVPKFINRGQVVKINITDGGSGYVSAPAVTISAPASGVQATATATITGGVVTAITITNPGYGYVESDNIAVTFDSGTAAATAVVAGLAYNGAEVFFVDESEAQQEENKARGFVNAGWWLYKTYTDTNNTVRHKAECLVALTETAANAGDAADDAVLVDRSIVILTQPADQEAAGGVDAVFTVLADVDPTTTLTYQWEVSTDGTIWSDITGATTDTLTVTSVDPEYVDGNAFRVSVGADGASTVVSDPAVLTVTA